jgi:hypothetical protein
MQLKWQELGFVIFILMGFVSAYADSNPVNDTSIGQNNGQITGWVLDKTAVSFNSGDLGLQRNAAYFDYTLKSRFDFDFGIRARAQSYLTPTTQKQIDIRALTIGKQYDNWSWLLGKQLITWGKADGFRVLDVVNPYDYTEFVLDEMIESKKALTMLRTDYFFNNSNSLQVLIIPEYRSDTIPSPSSEFYPLPSEFSSFQANQTNNPNDFLVRNCFNSTTGQILSQPVREQLFGGSLDFPWHSFVLRSEVVFSPKVPAPGINNFSLQEYQEFSNIDMVLGLDYVFKDWFLSGQFFTTKWMGNKLTPVGGKTQNTITFLLQRKFHQDKLKFRIFGAYDQTNKGNWVEPSLTWDFGKGLESSVGVDIFKGSQNSIFGRFSNNSRVYFTLKWSY